MPWAAWPESVTFVRDLGGDASFAIPPHKDRDAQTSCALVLATSDFAQAYDRADIIQELCRPDGCDEFAILAASPLTRGGEGRLMQTRGTTFHLGSFGRRALSEETRSTIAFDLALFFTKESREMAIN